MACSLSQPGKFRTVDRLLCFAASCLCAWSLATAIAEGQPDRPRYLLTPAHVVDEMRNRQLPTRGVEIKLAVPITAAIANPSLEIQAVALLNSHEIRLRMNCRDRSECLSFFATATYPEELNAASIQTTFDGRPGIRAATEVPRSSTQVKQAGHAESPMLRSGSPATLDLDEERVHIRIEVICLESGAAGDKIRVISRDRKQVYIAKVVTPTLLKGNF